MDEVLVGQRAVPKTLLDLSEDDYQLYLKDDRWRVNAHHTSRQSTCCASAQARPALRWHTHINALHG